MHLLFPEPCHKNKVRVVVKRCLCTGCLHPEKVVMKGEWGTFAECTTYATHMLKCVIADWQHINVSRVNGGSIPFTCSISHVDFLESKIVRFHENTLCAHKLNIVPKPC